MSTQPKTAISLIRLTDSIINSCYQMSGEYTIRLAKQEELLLLNDLENAAAEIFKNTKYALEIDQKPLSLSVLKQQHQQNLVWVAVNKSDRLVGFAVVLIVDGLAHLHELSVAPQYGRQGIGTKLTKEVINWAKQANFPGITLSTFRDIAWNAPFYRKLGFREIPKAEISTGLDNIRRKEAAAGLPIEERILMILKFQLYRP